MLYSDLSTLPVVRNFNSFLVDFMKKTVTLPEAPRANLLLLLILA